MAAYVYKFILIFEHVSIIKPYFYGTLHINIFSFQVVRAN